MHKLRIAIIVTGLLTVLTVLCSVTDANQNDALIEASRKGDVKRVQGLLNKGADANAKDKDGALTQKHDLKVWRRQGKGWTPLMWAANAGQLELAKLLVERGADVNARTQYGETALMLACQNGQAGIVRLLLDKGAEVNAKGLRTVNCNTPLTKAIAWGHFEVARLLLDKDADVNAKDEKGETTLIQAAGTTNTSNVEIVKLLLDYGADVNARGKNGKTPLIEAAGSLSPRRPDIVRILLEKGAHVDSKDKNGRTALMCAVEPECIGSTSSGQMIRCGPRAFLPEDALRCKDTMQLLLDKGADVNARDEDGRTALVYASEPLVEIEGERDSVTQIECGYEGTALTLKIKNGTVRVKRGLPLEIIELLKAHGAKE